MKLGGLKPEDPSRAASYFEIARALRRTAEDLDALGQPKYGNGLAIVAIHSAIAYADALTVAYRGHKSADGDHSQASKVLQNALGTQAEAAQVRRLRRILDAKSHASYSGRYYTLADGRAILEDLRTFAEWAEELYARRPPS